MSQSVTFELRLRDMASSGLASFGRNGQAAFAQVDSAIDNTQRKGMSLSGLFGSIGAVAAGAGMAGLAGYIYKVGAQAEQTKIAYDTLLQSETKSLVLRNELEKFADVSPFNTSEVMNAGQTLLGFGVKAQGVLGVMNMLGDASKGNANTFKSLVDNYGKMTAAQRGNTEDLNQFATAGIPIWEELGKIVGKQGVDLRKHVEKNGVELEDINTIFKRLNSEGGMFFEMMAKQSQSTGGKLSTFTSKLEKLGVKVFTALQPGINGLIDLGSVLLEKVTPVLADIYHFVSDNADVIGGLTLIAGVATGVWYGYTGAMAAYAAISKAGGLYTMIMTGAQWALNLALNANPIGIIITGLALFAAAIYTAYQKSEGFRGAVWGLWEATKAVFGGIAELGKNVFGSLSDIIIGAFTLDKAQVERGLMGLKTAFADFGDNVKGAYVVGAKMGREDFAKDQAERKSKPGGLLDALGGGGGGSGTPPKPPGLDNNIKAGVAGVQGSTQNRSVIVNINDGLVKSLTIQTTNLNESSAKIEEAVNIALIKAVRDFELAA